MRYLPPVALFLFSLLLSGCYELSPAISPSSPVKLGIDGGPQVDLQTLDWDGLQQLIASHRGKVVVLDCWSTSCAPCIKEFPNLVALHKRHNADDLACISVSFDYEGIGRPEDVREPVIKFLNDKRATFDNVLSSLDSDALTAKLDIPSIPAVFVYDREGKLAARFDNRHASRSGGPFNYEQVSAVVERLLEHRSEDSE